ncbi:peptidoglycan-binding protein [Oceanicola sp. 22II-s10i]|nr:peptidoglycan-binding protein [Oceanicola sp. 22II-s10i]
MVGALPAAPVRAEVGMAFMQAVAEASARDRDVAKWYRDTGYAPVWTAPGDEARMRRAALLDAFAVAHAHALPEGKYSADKLRAMMSRAVTPRDLGRLEAELTRVYLDFATDIQTGVLVPREVDDGIKREVPLRSVESYMTGITSPDPVGFVRGLAPRTGEYTRLLKAKLDLEYRVNHGGWGAPVAASSLKPGQEGRDVVALRNRLIAMGYLPWSVGTRYDAEMQMAVQTFQEDHGLLPDGVAGAGTMTEINVPIGERLKSVIVALERERWMNMERGKRHILVNLTDFHARIMDDDKLTFVTRSVIGQNTGDRRSPEFSDEMDHLVINPTWNVPRSIATKEYLPAFKRNPYSNSHLKLYNARGQVVDRGSVNFAAYNERNFPFDVKQPPSSRNALGLVKFMFPNKYNIYLHDTPSKSLFDREARDFSHGCIRLADPFDFAYELLSRQEADPQGFFQSILRTGRETRVNLKEPVPVHLIYRTAVTDPKGRITFRRDVYGRDGRVWDALQRAGVILPGGQS